MNFSVFDALDWVKRNEASINKKIAVYMKYTPYDDYMDTAKEAAIRTAKHFETKEMKSQEHFEVLFWKIFRQLVVCYIPCQFLEKQDLENLENNGEKRKKTRSKNSPSIASKYCHGDSNLAEESYINNAGHDFFLSGGIDARNCSVEDDLIACLDGKNCIDEVEMQFDKIKHLLTKEESFIAEAMLGLSIKGKLSYREMSQETGLSLGSVYKIAKNLGDRIARKLISPSAKTVSSSHKSSSQQSSI